MRLISGALDLLYPPKCPFCQCLLEGKTLLCPHCQETLPWLTGIAAERKLEFVSLCVSPLAYRRQVADSIHRYKFSGRKSYAGIYGALTAQCVADHLANRFDVVSWVPLSAKRLRQRGYDQAQLIAQRMGERLGTPPKASLIKIRNTSAQSTLQEQAQRRANVLGAYAVLPKTEPSGQRFLLVDDVVTTGSTLSECAKALLLAGASEVVAVTLAQAGNHSEKTRETGNFAVEKQRQSGYNKI